MLRCHRCQSEVSSKERIGRRDTCPGCGADLHCCLNCAFYDLHYANACREPNTDPVLDKEAGNFCEFFSFAQHQGQQQRAATDARAQLEALFKKKKT
jgi:hypothetical protein